MRQLKHYTKIKAVWHFHANKYYNFSKTIAPGDIDFMFVRNRHHPYFTAIQQHWQTVLNVYLHNLKGMTNVTNKNIAIMLQICQCPEEKTNNQIKTRETDVT